MVLTGWYVGGGLRKQTSDLSSAAIAGIIILIVAVFLTIISTTYCFIRRPRFFRRQFNGGRASDYVDFGAEVPSPPPYDVHTTSLPPPYSATSSADKPPDYEVVLLRNGQCLYRPQAESDVAESDTADDQTLSRHSQHTTTWLHQADRDGGKTFMIVDLIVFCNFTYLYCWCRHLMSHVRLSLC